jgi:hypothetical protein
MHGAESPSEKLIVTQLVKKFLASYGIHSFITRLIDPTTGPYPEPDASTPHLPIIFPEMFSKFCLYRKCVYGK